MSLSAARIFASSLRQIRVVSLLRGKLVFRPVVQCQCRSLFNFGKPPPPPSDTPEDAMTRAKAIAEALMQKEELKKLATHPGALQAIQNLLSLLSKKGIHVGSGKPPNFTDMMRLAADTEFRDAVTAVKVEMKNAGVDLDNPELVQSVMSLSNLSKP